MSYENHCCSLMWWSIVLHFLFLACARWIRLLLCLSMCHLHLSNVYEGVKFFYKEEDETAPVNIYGESKVESEQYISENWSNYAILRSSIIYGRQTVAPVHGTNMQMILNVGGPNRLSRLQMAETVAAVRGYKPSLLKLISASSKKSKPDLATPSEAEIFVQTRTRIAGRKYKTDTNSVKEKIDKINNKLSTTGDGIDEIISDGKSNGSSWLLGRCLNAAKVTSTAGSTNTYAQDLENKIS